MKDLTKNIFGMLAFSAIFFGILFQTDIVFENKVALSTILGFFYKQICDIKINTRKKQ